MCFFFFFQAEDGIRDLYVTGVQTCALPICRVRARPRGGITGAGGVALVGGGADDGVAARAHAALAGVGPRTGIAVVAGAAVALRRVRARPRGEITDAGGVALVGGG